MVNCFNLGVLKAAVEHNHHGTHFGAHGALRHYLTQTVGLGLVEASQDAQTGATTVTATPLGKRLYARLGLGGTEYRGRAYGWDLPEGDALAKIYSEVHQ